MLLVIEKLHNLQYTLALLQYIMQLQVQENKMNEYKGYERSHSDRYSDVFLRHDDQITIASPTF